MAVKVRNKFTLGRKPLCYLTSQLSKESVCLTLSQILLYFLWTFANCLLPYMEKFIRNIYKIVVASTMWKRYQSGSYIEENRYHFLHHCYSRWITCVENYEKLFSRKQCSMSLMSVVYYVTHVSNLHTCSMYKRFSMKGDLLFIPFFIILFFSNLFAGRDGG